MSKGKREMPRAEMMPFRPAEMVRPTEKTVERLRREAARQGLDFQRDVAPRLFDHPGELFVNDRYDVIRERAGAMWHLSIRPHQPQRGRPWREFQRIKNDLVGPENEGVEIFPAESRLVDTADQYHLWVAAESGFRFPFGFDSGRLVFKDSKQ
jgi:hypothetical protein